MYGATTGLGHTRDVRLPVDALRDLQEAFVELHVGALGDPLDTGFFPLSVDGGPANRYGAGTFSFTAEDSDGAGLTGRSFLGSYQISWATKSHPTTSKPTAP